MYTVLLINVPGRDTWHLILARALDSLAVVGVASAASVPEQLPEVPYDMIIIDATVVSYMEDLVSALRETRPHTPIVIVTASPTWQRARGAFQAGAVEYIRKTYDSG